MMKKIYKKSQLLEVNNIPTEVIEGIKATIDVLNENYGADRDIELDLGGSILENFSKVLTESTTREQHKKLLHMIISEITNSLPFSRSSDQVAMQRRFFRNV